MNPSPLQPIHVFPYCHKISGGHSNAIRLMMLAERSQGLDSLTCCFFCDDPSLKKLRQGVIVARRAGPTGGSSDEQIIEVPLGAPRQIFHLHGINWFVMGVARCLHRKAAPYVMTSHGALSYHNPLHYLKKFIILNFLTGVVRNARGVHLLSQMGYTRFRQLMPTWHGTTLVLYHALDVPNAAEIAPLSRTDFGIPPDGFLFLYLGRLDVYTKGLDILVKALSRVSAGGTARLALVGPDWLGGQARLQELAETLGCADRVHFLGPQYDAKKWAALRLADVFVAPSRWDAGPVALLEALGVGRPAITSTRVNPAHDLVEHDAAYLCSPTVRALTRAMSTLMNDATLRRQLAAKAEAWVRRDCSPAVVGQGLGRFYEEALGASAR